MLILAILKWIGIIILSIFAFILLVLAYFLLLPIKYNIQADFNKKTCQIFVYDPLRFFRIRIIKEENMSVWTDFLFTIVKINVNKKKRRNVKIKDKKKGVKEDVANKSPESRNNEEKKDRKKPDIASLLKDDSMKYVFFKIIHEIAAFLKHIFPRIFIANLYYSLGSPDLTGYLTGALSVLPFIYSKDINIYPDFLSDNAYISGSLKIKGHVQLVFLIVIAVRLIADKKFRHFLQLIR